MKEQEPVLQRIDHGVWHRSKGVVSLRILALGLGGAGGRIVDLLYQMDRRSSKVACVQALAVDVDHDAITQLTTLPDTAKIFFPPVELSQPSDPDSTPTATIDIAEIAARVHTQATGETDAILICVGLGGSMADTAPHIIAALRSSVTEPIFALVTLPCLSEGERRSAKAADDIETIAPMLDGVILFDNETWHRKVKAQQNMLKPKERGFAEKLGLRKKKEQVVSTTQRVYSLLNDAIIRRITLILRAGEFKADGGIELAEVVLDAGEVLNTIRGMGFITIGYAVEPLPSHPLDFLAKLRPSGYYADEQMKKASRIVDLAKQAIYHEISAPCDITSAHKALILIAGPSHEISMKGFMTVRKWIDRSIAGLETRSGDYPVMSTRFIAIIIMLAGLQNIPRLDELREIRAQFRGHVPGTRKPRYRVVEPAAELPSAPATGVTQDEMIMLPAEKEVPVPGDAGAQAEGGLRRSPDPQGKRSTPADMADGGSPILQPGPKSEKSPVRRLVAVPENRGQEPPPRPAAPRTTGQPDHAIKKLLESRSPAPPRTGPAGTLEGKTVTSEQERKRIERELHKQRQMAIHGIRQQERGHHEVKPDTRQKSPPLEPTPGADEEPGESLGKPDEKKHVILRKQATSKVVIRKKAEQKDRDPRPGGAAGEEPSGEGSSLKETPAHQEDTALLDSWIQQVSERRKETPDDNGTVKVDENPRIARDDALVHTDLYRERVKKGDQDTIPGISITEPPREITPAAKKRDRSRDDDDLSWVS